MSGKLMETSRVPGNNKVPKNRHKPGFPLAAPATRAVALTQLRFPCWNGPTTKIRSVRCGLSMHVQAH